MNIENALYKFIIITIYYYSRYRKTRWQTFAHGNAQR